MTSDGGRSVQIPAEDVEALEFYAEDTGTSFDEIAQLLLSQGLEAYTQARIDQGQRYFAAPTS